MVKHIVMWKFNDGVSDRDRAEMKRRLEHLKEVVPELLEIEVGMDVSGAPAAMDMVLCSAFESMDDLHRYIVHPEHQKVVGFVGNLVSNRVVVDYEV